MKREDSSESGSRTASTPIGFRPLRRVLGSARSSPHEDGAPRAFASTVAKSRRWQRCLAGIPALAHHDDSNQPSGEKDTHNGREEAHAETQYARNVSELHVRYDAVRSRRRPRPGADSAQRGDERASTLVRS